MLAFLLSPIYDSIISKLEGTKMTSVSKLETTLEGVYKGTPKLPSNAKKAIVQYLPWINLIFGILTLYSAWLLWHWAHTVNALLNYANSLAQAYGVATVSTANHLTIGAWIGLVILVVEGLLFLAAFPATRDKKKSGWDLLFYVGLINIVYAVAILFTTYGGVGGLIASLIGSAIGFYFLFQIKDAYTK
jgi:hypothetical protein